MSNDRLRVLFLAADPFRDHAPLRLKEEVRALDHAVQRGTGPHALEFVPYFATRAVDLQMALLRHRPQIVHFSAPGGEPGAIWLQDEHGTPRAVDEHMLGSLFTALAGTTRVVVLDGCATAPVVEGLGEIVDYVVGMNRPDSDVSAIVFAETFYAGLAFGRSVRTAFELAVAQLRMHSPSEAAVPMLRSRLGVDLHAALIVEPITEYEYRVSQRLKSAGDVLNVSLTGNEDLKGYRPRPKPKPGNG